MTRGEKVRGTRERVGGIGKRVGGIRERVGEIGERVGGISKIRHRSDPLAPRSGERVRERGRRASANMIQIATAAGILSLTACGASPPAIQGDLTPFQSPSDSTGGYVLATIPAGTGTPRATLYDATSQTQLASFVAPAPGAALTFWWTTAPAQTTRIALRDDAGSAIQYDLTPTYTPVADTFEPNDAMDTATPMPADGQMSAFLFAGHHDGTSDPSAFDDYYRFTAQPGALTIHLDDVPADLAARLFLFRADGSEVARVSNGMRGVALALTPPAMTDTADLIVRVSLWDETPPAAGAGPDLPPSFTHPYRLSVSQSQP
jgi:hypothetical protein